MAAAGILGTTRSPRLNATSSECYVKPHTMIFAMKIKLSVSKQTRCRIRMKAFKLYVLHVAILKRLAFTTSGWAGEEVVNLTAWFFWLAASTKKKPVLTVCTSLVNNEGNYTWVSTEVPGTITYRLRSIENRSQSSFPYESHQDVNALHEGRTLILLEM